MVRREMAWTLMTGNRFHAWNANHAQNKTEIRIWKN
jgi:hypothetical protein